MTNSSNDGFIVRRPAQDASPVVEATTGPVTAPDGDLRMVEGLPDWDLLPPSSVVRRPGMR